MLQLFCLQPYGFIMLHLCVRTDEYSCGCFVCAVLCLRKAHGKVVRKLQRKQGRIQATGKPTENCFRRPSAVLLKISLAHANRVNLHLLLLLLLLL